jgi:sulfofructose kinase
MQVVCVGLATRDAIWRVPEFPEPDGRVVATELVVAGGGPAATAAVTLARLGIDVGFAGAVGDDDAGRFVREGLEAEGVDVTLLATVAGGRTPESTILVSPDGARSIVHHPGSAPIEELEVQADWVHVDHAGYGRARKVNSIDGGNPIPGLSLEGVALYAPTESRLRADFGDAESARTAGAEVVVVTRGADGSAATTGDGVIDAPGVPCDPVSTLGAGDVFHGAFALAITENQDIPSALRFASASAALKCTRFGGAFAAPQRAEVEELLSHGQPAGAAQGNR